MRIFSSSLHIINQVFFSPSLLVVDLAGEITPTARRKTFEEIFKLIAKYGPDTLVVNKGETWATPEIEQEATDWRTAALADALASSGIRALIIQQTPNSALTELFVEAAREAGVDAITSTVAYTHQP